MRSKLRQAVVDFYPQVKDKLTVSVSYMEASKAFLDLHPNMGGYAIQTVRKYLIETHTGKKKFHPLDISELSPIEEQVKPDLSGNFGIESNIIDIPASWAEHKPTYRLSGFQKLGVISDIHLPYHDVPAIQAALYFLKDKKIDALLINGDLMDFKSITHHPGRERIKFATIQEEVNVGRKFLTVLRQFFPNIPIFYKEGNHEVWLTLAVNKVPQLATLEGIDTPSLLKIRDYDIQFVPEWQVMEYGRLNIIHGHEIKVSGIHVAANLLRKAGDNILSGHFHREQHFQQRNINGNIYGAWVLGCLADLKPHYAGCNPQSEHGCGIVDLLDDSGMFKVTQQRIYNGRII